MKLFCILLTAILCASASAQTIKTLGFNSTNGQVVANTGTNTLQFTNTVNFGADFSVASTTAEFQWGGVTFFEPETKVWYAAFSFDNTTNSATTRANLGFSTNLNTLWTATNASNARSAVGLGWPALTNSNSSTFLLGLDTNSKVVTGRTNAIEFSNVTSWGGDFTIGANGEFSYGGTQFFGSEEQMWYVPFTFNNTTNAATTRTNLGLPLAALTNASNVTMMRALSGSTNTNHPYSGSISVTGTNNTNTLVFSNGILQSVQ